MTPPFEQIVLVHLGVPLTGLSDHPSIVGFDAPAKRDVITSLQLMLWPLLSFHVLVLCSRYIFL